MSRIRQMFGVLRARYGTRTALAVVTASAALAVVPLPGVAFLPVLLAECIIRSQRSRLRVLPVVVRSKD